MDIDIIKEGWHYLEGFCDHEEEGGYETYSGVIVRIDGKNYFAYENPDDGYRSYSEFEETDAPCTNIFPPQRVMIKTYDDENDYTRDKGIIIANPDFELILKIGTDNYDDYYPMAVYEWHPENLPINKNFKDCGYKMPADVIMKVREVIPQKEDLADVLNMLDGCYKKFYKKGVSDTIMRIDNIIEDLGEYSSLSSYVSACENIKTLIEELKKEK